MELLGEVVERECAADVRRALVKPASGLVGQVVFVGDLADDLLEQVRKRDEVAV